MIVEAEIKAFLRAYVSAFLPTTLATAAGMYETPATMIVNDQVSQIHSKDALFSALNAVMKALVAQGFDHSEIDNVYVHPLTERAALVSANFSRCKTDGAVLERLGATYTVVKKDHGYRIVTVVAHGPEAVIKNQPA